MSLKSLKPAGSFLLLTVAAWVFLSLGSAPFYGQSTSQDYPTPVLTNEISGVIKPRDIGDPRLTTYFYTFNGNQGDVFVNVVSKNFNGSVDVYNADGLRLLTRVVAFADASDSETGRVFYLRKPERLLLRIEGRTPNDDAATFRIKFAGSFVAATETSVPDEPKLPDARAENDSGIRVNSAGAIIERRPKPTPAQTPGAVETAKRREAEDKSDAVQTEPVAPTVSAAEKKTTNIPTATVVVEDTTKAPPRAPRGAVARAKKPASRQNKPMQASETTAGGKPAEPAQPVEDKSASTVQASQPTPEEQPASEPAKRPKRETNADPLANVNLVVEFKDGRRIERPMSDVFRFSVNHGSLTIISKEGKISRFPVLDISKVTIQ